MPLTLKEVLELKANWFTEVKCSCCENLIALTNDGLINAGSVPLVCDDCLYISLGNLVERYPIGIPRVRRGSYC